MLMKELVLDVSNPKNLYAKTMIINSNLQVIFRSISFPIYTDILLSSND